MELGLEFVYKMISECPLEELEVMRDRLIPQDRHSDIFAENRRKWREANGVPLEDYEDIKNQALDMAEILINLRISELKTKKNE